MTRQSNIQAIIARQEGSEIARERCAVLMRVMSGELTMEAAAAEVGLSTQRLHELRDRMAAMSVTSLEPQAAGRPPAPAPDAKDERIAALEAELGRTRRDLDCALIRAELALTFGDRLGGKKTRSPRPDGARTRAVPAKPPNRPHQRHLDRLRAIARAAEKDRQARCARERGDRAQRASREMEAALRRRALAAVRRGRAAGDDPRHIAAALGLDPERLRAWQHEHDDRVRDGIRPLALGRRPLSCNPDTAKEMRHHLAVFGPGVRTRELHAEFPDVSFRDCAQIAWRFRRDLKLQIEDCSMTACTWTVPGTVWAADVWQPAQPVDGCYPYILDVRDLASGCMLESMPLVHATAEAVSSVIERLYRTLGAPFVIKTDNGSEFVAEGTAELHHAWGVEQLRSPPYLPSYNGACEAGHGSIRYRAEMLARRDGSPGQWSLDHLEGARLWANDLCPRPAGLRPIECFAGRATITQEQRAHFREAVARVWSARWRDLFVAAQNQKRTITLHAAQPTVSRVAISATLRNLGYLTTRNAPIRQGIPYAKALSISQ